MLGIFIYLAGSATEVRSEKMSIPTFGIMEGERGDFLTIFYGRYWKVELGAKPEVCLLAKNDL